ncbi:formate--tetrahydrofolate ligase [Oceanivirga salmonicida]|uniref:formate--tetrahydrofolate ligase n=1 Tax=Oceanivirga salmonicida TaxID=1769291 RepID=UPI00082B9586|nr:formate--tetrahydrofolate ligase [Oceanivirga salmonicida]
MEKDIEIAKKTKLKNINDICLNLGIREEEVELYGKYKAKINLDIFKRLETKSNGYLILVTAITPTKKGEGKSTVTIGLSQAFNKLGHSSIAALREPSMGPVFGLKGGATGGGYSQVLPMEDINLHFTGDFHAITAANNLIAACIDNHIYWGNELNIDKDSIFLKRTLDTNDRALRKIEIKDNKYTRQDSFQITVASEIMAILCLSNSLKELKEKVANMVVAKNVSGDLIRVRDLKVAGAVATILKDAIKPNIVQTIENTPAIIHGGPFANIAHGCNSILATKLALKLSDYTITEAGFAADLGAEKFFNIKCRQAGITPDMVVLVVTTRALEENGYGNLKVHMENIKKFNVPVIVSINKFEGDTEEDFDKIKEYCNQYGVKAMVNESYEKGSEGATDLVKQIINDIEEIEKIEDEIEKVNINNFEFLYSLDLSVEEKIDKLVKEIYRAKDIEYSDLAKEKLEYFKDKGIDKMPICMSKTPISITDNPKIKGEPSDYTFKINDIRPSFGADFLVVMSGNVIDMPGLPKEPAANFIDIDENEEIIGLF